ncbi:GspH/FimT family pseudopilin [Pseudomonas mendocina]|uniref:GspH/FimT family pseudopilin n=1 Tax=Ectopseudomonas mendocina TaxID=300 RepID=UPI0023DAFF27|nr:GspH/FimT family pseudopilin [Pseudomonas mendocina]MDF2076917.1 GspH/FimT family pseudopilin [Pseudomonas mendocina]
MHYSRAFTLIELMVTLAVLAVVISLAAPSFSNMLQENRLAAMSNELQGALQLARSEAVKRRANVTLCRSNADQTACDNETDWAGGWIMTAGTEVLKVWDPIQGVVVTGPNSGIVFRNNGMASAQSWTVTHSSCTGQQKRTISVNATGSTTLAKGDC